MDRIYAISISYFKGGWDNFPFYFLPIHWMMSPICILLGYFFLEDYLMNIYKDTDGKYKISRKPKDAKG